MNTELIKLKITALIENKKLLWNTFIALTAGIVALMLNVDNTVGVVLLFLGVVGDAVLIYTIIKVNETIDKILNTTYEEI